MSLDCLDNHLPAAGSIDRAAVPLGLFLAFCAGNGLISEAFARTHENLLLRLRDRDLKPAELLVAGCAGRLERKDLNAAGQQFADACLPGYLETFAELFGADVYDVEDSWTSYDKLAPVLAAALYGPGSRRHETPTEEKRWWQIWR